MRLLLLFVFNILIAKFTFAQLGSGVQIIEKCLQKIESIKTAEFDFTSAELLKNGKLFYAENYTKYRVKPFAAYLKIKVPEMGTEVLYKEGENAGKALIHPSGFPYVNVNFEPGSKILLKNGHHPVDKAGFGFILQLLRTELKSFANRNDINTFIVQKADKSIKGRLCYGVELTSPEFSFANYVVKRGENLLSIARNKNINSYVMVLRNKPIDDYYDIKEGQTIEIPTAFCSKSIMYIDKETLLPVQLEVYMNETLIERYQFYNVKLNSLTDEDFSRENKAYGF